MSSWQKSVLHELIAVAIIDVPLIAGVILAMIGVARDMENSQRKFKKLEDEN